MTVKFDSTSILQKRGEYEVFCANQKHFEHGITSGKLLALRLKQMKSGCLIPPIHDVKNNLVTN